MVYAYKVCIQGISTFYYISFLASLRGGYSQQLFLRDKHTQGLLVYMIIVILLQNHSPVRRLAMSSMENHTYCGIPFTFQKITSMK